MIFEQVKAALETINKETKMGIVFCEEFKQGMTGSETSTLSYKLREGGDRSGRMLILHLDQASSNYAVAIAKIRSAIDEFSCCTGVKRIQEAWITY